MSNRQKAPSLWKRVRYPLEALILELLAATVPLLSRKMLVRVANAIGWIAFHVAVGERRIALTNLDIAFGSTKSRSDKRRIACSAFQNFARSFLGLFWAKRLTSETSSSSSRSILTIYGWSKTRRRAARALFLSRTTSASGKCSVWRQGCLVFRSPL